MCTLTIAIESLPLAFYNLLCLESLRALDFTDLFSRHGW